MWVYLIHTPLLVVLPPFLMAPSEDFLDFRRVQAETPNRILNTALFASTGCIHAAMCRPLRWKLRVAGIFIGCELAGNALLSTRHSLGVTLLEYDLAHVIAPFMLGIAGAQLGLQACASMLDAPLPFVAPKGAS